MRLDKFIASQTSLSRGDVKKLIKQGAVTVDGIVTASGDMHISPDTSEIAVNGQAVLYKKYVYYMLNKPKGVVSATDDKVHKTVLDLVPDELSRDGLFPAGRLDADTTGFVLLTDDGDFAHRILSPKNHIEKTYIATLARPVTQEDISAFLGGIELSDGYLCLPAVVETTEDPLNVTVKICEGKYHQIKRMFAARDNRVVELKRIKMGGLALDVGLLPGGMREITQEELLKITNP